MGKRYGLAAIGLGLLIAAAPAPPALAASGIDSCLQDTSVCISDGAAIKDSQTVADHLQDKIKVAVVKDDSSNSLNPNQLASQIAQSSNTKELILVVDMGGADRYGVYSASGHGDQLLEALNGAGQSDGGEAIMAVDVSSIYSQAHQEQADAGGSLVFPLVLGVAAVLAIGGGMTFALKRRREGTQSTASAPKRAEPSYVPSAVSQELVTLRRLADRYSQSGEQKLREISPLMLETASHIRDLFGRLKRKGTDQDSRLAELRYEDLLGKLNGVLGSDYLEDLVNNPDLWEGSEAKVAAVISALRNTDKQTVTNIRRVNSSKELDFSIAMDALLQDDSGIPVQDAYRGSDRSS